MGGDDWKAKSRGRESGERKRKRGAGGGEVSLMDEPRQTGKQSGEKQHVTSKRGVRDRSRRRRRRRRKRGGWLGDEEVKRRERQGGRE